MLSRCAALPHRSNRLLSAISSRLFSTEAQSEEAAEVDFSKQLERAEKAAETHEQWISRKQAELARGSTGAYKRGDMPFPHNPLFKVQPPLNNATKNEIYLLYKSNPKKWTPRALSQKFHCSMPRVEGVIDLKQYQERLLSDGFQINEEYLGKMERLLNAAPHTVQEETRQIFETFRKRSPTFVSLPDGEELSFEKAAEILRLPAKFSVFHPEFYQETTSEEEPPRPIRFDNYDATRRFSYIITDIGSGVDKNRREIVVREKSGLLRAATNDEKVTEAYRIWGARCEQHCSLLKTRTLYRILSRTHPKTQF